MRAWIAVGMLATTLSATASAQQALPEFVEYMIEGIHWKFVSADRQARFGTVFTDAPTEFAPFFITCSGGQGTMTYTLPQGVDPAQTGRALRISVKGRPLDVRVTATDSMGAAALKGSFELAAMATLAQGTGASDTVEVSVGRWKMKYGAREFAPAFTAFRQACTGLKP